VTLTIRRAVVLSRYKSAVAVVSAAGVVSPPSSTTLQVGELYLQQLCKMINQAQLLDQIAFRFKTAAFAPSCVQSLYMFRWHVERMTLGTAALRTVQMVIEGDQSDH
jgi:hypothetical protein